MLDLSDAKASSSYPTNLVNNIFWIKFVIFVLVVSMFPFESPHNFLRISTSNPLFSGLSNNSVIVVPYSSACFSRLSSNVFAVSTSISAIKVASSVSDILFPLSTSFVSASEYVLEAFEEL